MNVSVLQSNNGQSSRKQVLRGIKWGGGEVGKAVLKCANVIIITEELVLFSILSPEITATLACNESLSKTNMLHKKNCE